MDSVDQKKVYEKRLRRLKPRECLRLMGFDDDFKIVVSDTQAYKQAGNSIVVNVLEAIFGSIDFERITDKENKNVK